MRHKSIKMRHKSTLLPAKGLDTLNTFAKGLDTLEELVDIWLDWLKSLLKGLDTLPATLVRGLHKLGMYFDMLLVTLVTMIILGRGWEWFDWLKSPDILIGLILFFHLTTILDSHVLASRPRIYSYINPSPGWVATWQLNNDPKLIITQGQCFFFEIFRKFSVNDSGCFELYSRGYQILFQN